MERRWLTRLTLTTLMMFIPIVGIACDPGEEVHIENRTAQTLTVFEDGIGFHELAPGDSATFGVLEFEGVRTYDVRTRGGIVLIKNCQGLCRVFLDVVGQDAFTVGHTIFARSEPGPLLLQHELNHVKQYEDLGDWFLTGYLANQVLLIPVCGFDASCYERYNYFEWQAGP